MSLRSLVALGLGVTLTVSTVAARAQDSLTLARSIDIGQRRAPEIAASQASLEGANADASAARAPYYPTLTASVTGQGTALRDTPVVAPGTVQPTVAYTGAATGALQLRWTVYDFGKTSNNAAAADANVSSATAALDNTTTTVTGTVASAYVTLAYREELRKVASATVQQRDKLFTLAKALVKQGLREPVEELRASSRLEAGRRALATAEADANDARQALGMLLGIEDAGLRVSKPRLPSVDAEVSRAMRAAEARRETIRLARANVEAKSAAKDAARARYLPTLSLGVDASYRFAENDATRMTTQTRVGTASIVLSGPLFDASIGAGVDRADALAAAAEAELTRATRDARTEAGRAANAVRGAAKAMEHAKRAEEEAVAVFAVVQARYAQGLATPAELIDAESADVDARTSRTGAEMAHALSVVRLLVATGQGKRLLEEGGQ